MVVALPRRDAVTVDLGPITLPLADKDAEDVRKWKSDEDDSVLAVGDLLPVRVSEDGATALLAQPPALQGALVAIEPQTGRVRALVGGYDWMASQFDRASQADASPTRHCGPPTQRSVP